LLLRLHRKIVKTFSPLAPAIILLYCTLFLLLLGWLDLFTGVYSQFVFYLIPVSFAAWFVSERSGILFCLLSAAIHSVANEWPHSFQFTYSLLQYWNKLVELIFLIAMSLLFSALRENLDNEKKLARHDPLTDTLNRRSFYDLAEHEINRAQRYELPLTVAYLDLDNFKTINDNFGHQSGDELLIAVVEAIRSNIRSSDVLARFGGDEFVILLSDTSGESAVKFLNKVRDHLNEMVALRGWPVSFSIGVVTYAYPPNIDEVVRYADELMYTVKRSGKNRLLHAEIGRE
jgi:diguanylate cyclase (GGDEF)-like protein